MYFVRPDRLTGQSRENNELKARLSRLAALPGLSERPNVTLNPSERQQLTSENGIRGNQSGGGAASFPKSDESNSKAIKETLIDLSIESDRNSPSDNTRRPEIDNVTNPRHTKPFTPSSLPLPNSPPQPEPHELERGLHAKTTGRTSDTLQSMPPPRFKLRDLLANREPNSIGQSASSLPRPFLPADHELPPTMSFTPAIEDFRYKQEALSKSREGNSARALSDTEGVRRCTPDMRQPSSPFYTPRAPRAPSLLVRHGMSSVVEPRASRRQQDHTRDINHGRSTASPFFPATPVRVDQRSRLRPADMQRPGTGACRNDQHYNGSGQRRLSLATQSPSVSRITGKPLSFSLSATDGQTELLQQRDPRSSYSNRTPSGLFTRSNPILPNLGRERQPPFVRGNSIHNRPANQYPETQKSAQTGAEGPSMSNGPDRPYPTNAIRGFRHLSIAPSVLSRYRNEHSTTTNLNRNPYISTPSRRIFGR